jgi:cation diffusion facilitator family transporter
MRDTIEVEQNIASKISIAGALLLFLISGVVGIAIDSITLILDASSSLVILAVALLTNFSLKRIRRPPDELYNFGYSKYEPFTGSLQGGLIIATCVISIKFAIQDIIHAESVKNYLAPVVATFLSGILGLLILFRIKLAAKRSKSTLLEMSAFHWYSDTLLSFSVCLGFLCGLLLERLGYIAVAPYVDPVMAIILAAFLIKTPFKNMIINARELLDVVPDTDIRQKARKVIDMYIPKSFGVQRMRIRKAGQRIFLDICFIVKSELTVKEIRELADNFEKDLKDHLENCDIVVYFHPQQSGK